MITYGIEVDQSQVKDAISLFEFVGGNSKDALRVAINRAAPKVKSGSSLPNNASKEIRRQVRLKAAYVNRKLTVWKATRTNLEGRIKAATDPVLLPRYSTDHQISGDKVSWFKPPLIPPRGIKVKVKPTGAAVTMSKDWFYMVLPKSRALAIARRKTELGLQGGKYDIAYAPSVSQVFGNDSRERLYPVAQAELQSQLLDAMRFLLSKKYPKE